MITLLQRPDLVGFRFDRPVRCLSSAVLGGGYTSPLSIVNLHVDKGYSGMNPAADIQAAAEGAKLPGPVVGLMTAVKLGRAVFASVGGVHVLATAGVSNALAAGLTPPWNAGLTPPWNAGVGTINLIAFIDGRATDGALAGAAITMTEAKVRALADQGVRCPETSTPATGTSTDAFAVAALEAGPDLPFLGPATKEGFVLARLVYDAVIRSLRQGA